MCGWMLNKLHTVMECKKATSLQLYVFHTASHPCIKTWYFYKHLKKHLHSLHKCVPINSFPIMWLCFHNQNFKQPAKNTHVNRSRSKFFTINDAEILPKLFIIRKCRRYIPTSGRMIWPMSSSPEYRLASTCWRYRRANRKQIRNIDIMFFSFWVHCNVPEV